MKTLIATFCLLALISCKSNSSEADGAFSETSKGGTSQTGPEASEIISHPMMGEQNKLLGEILLPANWKMGSKPGEAAFSGPGGIFVYNLPSRSFSFTSDPMMRQIYAQNGVRMRPYTSAADVVRQDFLPAEQQKGSRLIKIIERPDIAASDKGMSDLLFKVGPTKERFECVVSEWEDKDGNPYAIVIHLSGMDMGNMIMWNYYGQGLNAPKSGFGESERILLDGLASIRYNPRYFDTYNQSEQNKASASWAAHQSRMQNRQRQFDAQQAAHRDTWDAINNASMQAYNDRNAASDRNQNRFLNYIKDENTVTNPGDGNRYQVESGYNQYYMNGNGQYIGTNNPNYDPNRDPATNHQNWDETQIEN